MEVAFSVLRIRLRKSARPIYRTRTTVVRIVTVYWTPHETVITPIHLIDAWSNHSSRVLSQKRSAFCNESRPAGFFIGGSVSQSKEGRSRSCCTVAKRCVLPGVRKL